MCEDVGPDLGEEGQQFSSPGEWPPLGPAGVCAAAGGVKDEQVGGGLSHDSKGRKLASCGFFSLFDQ